MITLTEAARKKFEDMHRGKEKRPIRIYQEIAWGTSSLKLAQGEPEDNDLIFETGEFTFVVSTYVSQRAGEITIDFTAQGFVIRSKLNSNAVPGGSCSVR